MDNLEIKTDTDYDPNGDCEPYDTMIDDKLTEDKRNERAKNEKYFRNN